MTWSGLSEWWRDELAGDSAYEEVVTPLLLDVLSPRSGELLLDIGSGEGRVMRTLHARGASVVGVEGSLELATVAGLGSVVVAEVPPLPIGNDTVDHAYMVLVLEHLPDHGSLFEEAARVVRPGGSLAVVMNHPVWTAPGSTPITDSDGEILWRPGGYFTEGVSQIPAGDGTVVFHHRTMAAILTTAADAGWSLQRMEERPHHELPGQEGIPRLLACRWRLLP